MELPHLGEHCQDASCKMLDFLPFRCDCCKKVFCKDHISYSKHNCDKVSLQKRDFQVPLCPLCNQPVPYKRNELPDGVMSAHIDRDCQSDPAEERRRQIFKNKCSEKGCKQKELIPFMCQRCNKNYCIRHRLESDHDCVESRPQQRVGSSSTSNNDLHQRRLAFYNQASNDNGSNNQRRGNTTSSRASSGAAVNNNMSDSEALEYALKLSLSESKRTETTSGNALVRGREGGGGVGGGRSAPIPQLSQAPLSSSASAGETEDEMLARAIAESQAEYLRSSAAQQADPSASKKDASCSIN